MAILYVAAESAELKPFASSLTGLRKLKWPLDYAMEGVLDGRRVLLAANGAGPKLASRAVEVAIRSVSAAELSASKLEAVVSTGFCGALDSSLTEEQIVIGTRLVSVNNEEPDECAMAASAPEGFVAGPVFSQDKVACSPEDKRILGATGAIAVEMEASGVRARTKRAGLPFYCIKVVSDRADECFGFDLNAMRTTEGRIARGKIVGYALTHPRLLPELFRLKQRSERAAKALGEFLVSCRIRPEQNHSLAD